MSSGLPARSLPAADFIGHIIFWDQQTAQAMAAKIEAVTGLHWTEALCRTREFSEYMLYGYFVEERRRPFGPAHHHPAPPVRQLLGSAETRQRPIEPVALPRRQGRRRLFGRFLLGHAGANHPRRHRGKRDCPGRPFRRQVRNRGTGRVMLIGQASINLSANILPALLGYVERHRLHEAVLAS